MPGRDPRIDAFIQRARPFAQPILTELRKRVHRAVPNVEETMKWSMPFFALDGKLLATMAAFNQHARFGLWPSIAAAMKEPAFISITRVSELPPAKQMERTLKRAVEHLTQGNVVKFERKRKPPLPVPKDLALALKKKPKAGAAFKAMPPGVRRDYSEWISTAKQPETRARRLAAAVALIAQGKERNWKHRPK